MQRSRVKGDFPGFENERRKTMNGTNVIHDGDNNFLGFNCRSWVPGADGDIFQGSYCNAVRVARKATRKPGQRVFVSANYGLMDQEDKEVLTNGDMAPSNYPNQK